MVKIDRTNAAIVGLDLYSVAQRHQSDLVEVIIQAQITAWQSNPAFLSASVHQSLDGVLKQVMGISPHQYVIQHSTASRTSEIDAIENRFGVGVAYRR
jgi:hypothetical protein